MRNRRRYADCVSLDGRRALRKALAESEGAALHSDIQALARSRRLFEKNCEELLTLLNSTRDTNTALQLFSVENRAGFDRFLDEVDRLLHNALAAAVSLRDHSYRVRDKWMKPEGGDQLRQQHDERVKAVFAESTTAQLVEGLRNIYQHRKLPRLLGHTLVIPGEVFKSSIVFDTDDLLKWDGWRPEIRALLIAREDPISLDELVTEYRAAVDAFHEWFGSAVRQRNTALLGELQKQLHEVVEYERSLFGPAIDDPSRE